MNIIMYLLLPPQLSYPPRPSRQHVHVVMKRATLMTPETICYIYFWSEKIVKLDLKKQAALLGLEQGSK